MMADHCGPAGTARFPSRRSLRRHHYQDRDILPVLSAVAVAALAGCQFEGRHRGDRAIELPGDRPATSHSRPAAAVAVHVDRFPAVAVTEADTGSDRYKQE